jgi:hypothetical protein
MVGSHFEETTLLVGHVFLLVWRIAVLDEDIRIARILGLCGPL